MSGETEQDVSGWTVDTLHLHIIQRLGDLDRLLSRRMDDADKAIQAALAAAEKATGKAETASEKRFEGVNEFRGVLQDQQQTLITRSEHAADIKSMGDRVTANADRVAALELRLTSRLDTEQGRSGGERESHDQRRLDTGQIIAYVIAAVAVLSLLLDHIKP
jgi:hypothetical protein